MGVQRDFVAYYDLDFSPRLPEEALVAIKKIGDSDFAGGEPDVTKAELKYLE